MNPDVIRVKALSHPLRMEIMKIYAKADKPMPIKEVAALLKQPPAKLHYHYRQLEGAGFLEVADTREINGITERYYRKTELELDISLSLKENPDAVAALMPMIQRKTLAALRRIQQLDPDRTDMGMGVFQEVTFPDDKAQLVKTAIRDFLDNKPAHLPDSVDEGNGITYDLVVLLVPRNNDL